MFSALLLSLSACSNYDNLAETEVTLQEDGTWAYFDKHWDLLTVYTFDNGPDYFSEWLARFVENGEIWYFNQELEKVIPAIYDWAFPFEKATTLDGEATAKVCVGCVVMEDGEHSMRSGWVRSVINTSGQIVWWDDEFCNYEAHGREYCDDKTISISGTNPSSKNSDTPELQHPLSYDYPKQSYLNTEKWQIVLFSDEQISCPEHMTVIGKLNTKYGPCDSGSKTKDSYCNASIQVQQWECK